MISKFGGLPIIIFKKQRDSPYLFQFRQLLHVLEGYELAYLYTYLSLFQSSIGYHERLNILLSQSDINLDLLEREKVDNIPDTSNDKSDIE